MLKLLNAISKVTTVYFIPIYIYIYIYISDKFYKLDIKYFEYLKKINIAVTSESVNMEYSKIQ